ncbi:amino-acid racemase [Enterococcus mundtii]|uniref:YhfX family PLP-dependent enzyme n=1 Tax=Enterococcus mundtii TaxID=53346 RepID=UPI000D3B3F85|nr:YhfX family PLP-dependent enzyme [Enterococcus mundtii]PTO38652.1 amino-acid racemase [Enterococcus mundtii]PTO41504.1 amino-acid racemase [Enterococcus mundtii]
MFLDVTARRNQKLIDTAVALHKKGLILPDTYILDLDTIEENTSSLVQDAKKEGIRLFYMTKQLGRNPFVAQKIHEAGIEKAVVVDYKEALIMMEQGLPLGNVGHLVQIPKHLLKRIMTYGVEFITVYSLDLLQQIISIAVEFNVKQKVLVKVIEDGDQVYEGQFGGFHLDELPLVAQLSNQTDAVEITGVTSFPCFLFDEESKLLPTSNVQTINKAKKIFKECGIEITEVNVPSATCHETIPLIKEIGGTQGEPGHALTGTTPLHAKLDLPEKPAMVYVSEISHNLDGQAYFYGGGYYRRGHLDNVLIDSDDSLVTDSVAPFSDVNIDYYLSTSNEHPVGSTVVAAFRTQIFVTRSDVAVVSGIQKGSPKIEGIYDSLGKLIRR